MAGGNCFDVACGICGYRHFWMTSKEDGAEQLREDGWGETNDIWICPDCEKEIAEIRESIADA